MNEGREKCYSYMYTRIMVVTEREDVFETKDILVSDRKDGTEEPPSDYYLSVHQPEVML